MSQPPPALKYLALNWFAIVMSFTGLALAWTQAARFMGQTAEAISLLLSAAAALVFVVLSLASIWCWRHYPQALAEDMRHPVRHAFVAAVPASLLLLAAAATTHIGPGLLAVWLWWAGSISQLALTVWVIGRWLSPDKASALTWPALTPTLLIAAVGNVLAPLAGVQLGLQHWSLAQFGIGVLLWPMVLALLMARIAGHGPWPERLLPLGFITIAPPAVIGSGVLLHGGPVALAWMCWGMALFFTLCCGTLVRRMLAQPFAMALWSLGFPLAAFASLSLRLAAYEPGMQTPAILALALVSLVQALLLIATFKGLRQGTLLQPETISLTAVGNSPGTQP